MKQSLRAAILTLLLSFGLAFAQEPDEAATVKSKAETTSTEGEFSFTLVNESSWSIHEVFLSPADSNNWGPNQIRGAIGKKAAGPTDNTENEGASLSLPIESGEEAHLVKIPAGRYDLKLVDDEGDSCIMVDLEIKEDREFVVDNQKLVSCVASIKAATESADPK